MKPDQERLSEQAKDEASRDVASELRTSSAHAEDASVGNELGSEATASLKRASKLLGKDHGLDALDWIFEVRPLLDSLARQLTEAKRENGRLQKALQRLTEYVAWVHEDGGIPMEIDDALRDARQALAASPSATGSEGEIGKPRSSGPPYNDQGIPM